MWEIEYTDEFDIWWQELTEAEQIDIAASVGLLEKCGPIFVFPTLLGLKIQGTHICVS